MVGLQQIPHGRYEWKSDVRKVKIFSLNKIRDFVKILGHWGNRMTGFRTDDFDEVARKRRSDDLDYDDLAKVKA